MVLFENLETGEITRGIPESEYNKITSKSKKNGASKTSKSSTSSSSKGSKGSKGSNAGTTAASIGGAAATAITIGTIVWKALTPEQKQAVISGGKKVIRKIVGLFTKKRGSSSSSQVNTNAGQFTLVNKPSSGSTGSRGKVLF